MAKKKKVTRGFEANARKIAKKQVSREGAEDTSIGSQESKPRSEA